MINFRDVMSKLFTLEELKTTKVADKVNKLCDEDIIFCNECPYYHTMDDKCTINEYLK